MKTIFIILGLFAGSRLANATTQVNPSPDRPVRLYVESYNYDEHGEVHPSGQGCDSSGSQTYSFAQNYDETWHLNWADGSDSGASRVANNDLHLSGSLGDHSISSTQNDTYHWNKSDWPDFVEGTITSQGSVTYDDGETIPQSSSGTANALTAAQSMNSGGLLWIGYEHCKVKGSQRESRAWFDSAGGVRRAQDNVVYSRSADTVMKLYTGGKALSLLKRQNVFAFSGGARRTQG